MAVVPSGRYTKSGQIIWKAAETPVISKTGEVTQRISVSREGNILSREVLATGGGSGGHFVPISELDPKYVQTTQLTPEQIKANQQQTEAYNAAVKAQAAQDKSQRELQASTKLVDVGVPNVRQPNTMSVASQDLATRTNIARNKVKTFGSTMKEEFLYGLTFGRASEKSDYSSGWPVLARTAGVVGGIATIGLATPRVAQAAPQVASGLWRNKAATGVSAALGVGAVATITYGTQLIGKKTFTQSQKEIIQNKAMRSEINKQVGLGREAVNKADISYKGTSEQIIDWTRYVAGSGEGQKAKVFEFEVRKGLQQSGLFAEGGQLEEAVAIAKQQRRSKRVGEIGAIIASGATSELFARNILKRAPASVLTNKNIVSSATKVIGVAGFGEGVAVDVALTMGGTSKFNPIRTAGMGFGGALSAGAIGGKVVELNLASKGSGKAGLAGAYVADPSEYFGDVTADIGEKLYGATKSSIRPRVTTFTNIFTSTESKTPKSSININNIMDSNKKPTVKGTAVSTFVKVPTMTLNLVNTPRLRQTVNIPSITRTRSPVSMPSITNIPNIINTPVNIPSIVKTPTSVTIRTPTSITTNIPVNTNTPVTTNIPTITNIPVTVPTIKFPFIIPGGGGGGKGWNFGGGAKRVGSKYTPSLVASVYNIRSRTPNVAGGLGIRAIQGNPGKLKKGKKMMNFVVGA